MPSVPIYIRQEDWDKWREIEDKPAFIHNALNSVQGTVAKKEIIKTPQDAERAINAKLEPTVPAKVIDTKGRELEGKFCPNGHSIPNDGRNKCMGKGCKYS